MKTKIIFFIILIANCSFAHGMDTGAYYAMYRYYRTKTVEREAAARNKNEKKLPTTPILQNDTTKKPSCWSWLCCCKKSR